MKKQLSQMKEQQKSTSENLEAALKKLSRLNVRNVNKREATKDKKIEELSKEVHEHEEQHRQTLQQLLEKNETLESVNEKLILAGEAKRCEQRMKSYYKCELEKRKAVIESNEIRVLRSILKEQQEILYLENENAVLEERIDHFLNHEVDTFEGGTKMKFDRSIRTSCA